MSAKNTTGKAKWDNIARDYRIASIRAATEDETDGDTSMVMVTLIDGYTVDHFNDGSSTSDHFLATGIRDLQAILKRVYGTFDDGD